MNQKKSFLYQLFVGILLFVVGLIVIPSGYYQTLCCATGIGLCASGGIWFLKLCYYEMPSHRPQWEARRQEAHIDSIDERKIYLRTKSGALTFQIMTFVLLVVSFILALFHVEAWIITLVFGLLILQSVISLWLYRHFQKTL